MADIRAQIRWQRGVNWRRAPPGMRWRVRDRQWQRLLTTHVAKLSPGATDPGAMIGAWKARYALPIARLAAMRDELKRAGSLDLAVLSVLLRELRGLA